MWAMASHNPVRAAFDVPLDPGERTGQRLRGAFLAAPRQVLIAPSPRLVPGVVAGAEAAAAAGRWVVGGLTYEAGSAWDPAQRTHPGVGPTAYFEVFDAPPVPWPSAPPAPSLDWFPSARFTAGSPGAAIAAVQRHIGAGDCYQANLTGRMATVAAADDLYPLFVELAARQPGGYAVFLQHAGLASVSPELFFQTRADRTILTQPMKGTAPDEPGAGAALASSPKDRAENLMIVDLLRNDLGRVCRPGSVGVDALFELLKLPTVWQLTSTVSGSLTPGIALSDIFAALFPCGSVTGAPKIRAMEIIAAQETAPRGWYCGATGVIRPGGEAIFNVAIRTVERGSSGVAGGTLLTCGVGSGIVADSSASAELAEWRAKTRFLGGPPLAALETLLLAEGQYPHLARHLRRLSATDAALGLGIDLASVRAGLAERAAQFPGGRHRVRLLASSEGFESTVSPAPVTALPVRLALATEPLAVAPLAAVVEHKTSWRFHYDRLRATAGSGVFDVICHTPAGLVTECTTGNLALELDGRWVTPAAGCGLLPGVERAARIEAGHLSEAEVTLGDLGRARGLAFLNGLRGWCPAVLVD